MGHKIASSARILCWRQGVSTPHGPQSNGAAECAVGRVLEGMRVVLMKPGLPHDTWSEAARCSRSNQAGRRRSNRHCDAHARSVREIRCEEVCAFLARTTRVPAERQPSSGRRWSGRFAEADPRGSRLLLGRSNRHGEEGRLLHRLDAMPHGLQLSIEMPKGSRMAWPQKRRAKT